MNNRKYLFLEKYSKLNSVISSIAFALLTIGLVTNDAYANFATTESSTVAACPANHKMYYIGANAPTSTQNFPVVSQALSWDAGNATKTFTFTENSGTKSFVINFPILLDLNNFFATPPFYGSLNGITTSAINLDHDSPAVKTNHSMNVSINRPVSKVGYKIQDLDSTSTAGQIPYIEEVDVSANQGQLTFNTSFHTRNIAGNVVTARSGLNCSTGQCTIDASWNYNLANTSLNLKHNNTFTQRNSPHTVGYSDFYFCLAPPKLIVKKVLNGTRVKTNDQFEIVVSGGSVATNSFTTTGTGSTITNGTSATLSLSENTNYTITERAMNGTTLGDIANYDATYVCNNATTGSPFTTTNGTATLNAETIPTRSFALSNLNYGDEITCTITNTPAYTFSGTVFDDNGGITAADSTKQNITSTFTANSAYFNGILDSNESGIFDSALQITLTNCNGTKVVTRSANPQTVSSLGKYNFTVQSGALPTRICLVETEPTSWVYSVDTTANTREVSLTNGTYIYNNLDFGEVKADNTALVLIKYQYVHECNSNLDYTSVTNTSDPSTGFSTSAPSNTIIPGKCIAYKIEAYNRGHISLVDIQISDVLQNVKVKSEFHLPKASGVPSDVFKTTNQTAPIGQNGTIVSDKFTLSNTSSSTTTSKTTLYFNTKYGTTSGT
ncbi:hypothetical protein [Psychrobacter sp. K31L]|uniref:hypothetical protein n=1 Tax=Psychrobacter sp. K31L TaxID=2820758 RepID=UPI001B3347BF|nr:hypothetical protein [Psychrobacter sp. K31L]MBP3944945.1 hypothetical protein [Psychrobacter sp. K31L]